MTITHIKNVDILTLDEQGSILKNTNLVIENENIMMLGEIPDDFQTDEMIDGHGKVAMPGLVNSHCHSPMTILRGWAEDMRFPEWLQKIWSAENHLTPEDIYWSAALAAAEMIRSGTVAYADNYFFMDRVAQVADESGLKALLAWGVFDAGQGTKAGAMLDQTLEWIKEIKAQNNPRIKAILGPHSPYTCSPAFLEEFVRQAHELDLGIHIHVAESQEQVDESLEKYGLRPVQHVDRLGLFDVPGGCISAHTIYVDETDIAILAEKGVYVPHCPNTYMKLAMPFFPLKPRLDAGVKVCLGTDGPASNASMDLFVSIRQTALMHKYLQHDPQMIPGDLALRMATQVGAEALGFTGSGVLKVGAPADLILIDLDVPHLRPMHNLVANIVHSAYSSDVKDVMVAGKWLMRDRQLLTLDEDKIMHEAERCAFNLVNKV